tara:strand:+ start:512 stop:874 length:363 start_codon:yes stop_codon:yes gene_type:complete
MMKNIFILGTASLLMGCPDNEQVRVEVSNDCAIEYAVAVVDAAGSEEAACEAAFDAVHLADEGSEDLWYEYHTEVWNNPPKNLVEDCTDDLAVRAEFLYNDQILRFRCIASCEGHDPEDC